VSISSKEGTKGEVKVNISLLLFSIFLQAAMMAVVLRREFLKEQLHVNKSSLRLNPIIPLPFLFGKYNFRDENKIY